MNITHLNPDSLHHNPAFSQGSVVEGPAKTIYVGGQNGVDASGNFVGNDLRGQTEQALKNLLTVLKEAGASQENVVKMTIYIVQGEDINEGFAASQQVWGAHAVPVTVIIVSALGRSNALVEIEAVAAVES